jgi:hypothetical protein
LRRVFSHGERVETRRDAPRRCSAAMREHRPLAQLTALAVGAIPDGRSKCRARR